MTQAYKNDGFDLSAVHAPPVTHLFTILDLEEMEILGMYTSEELVERELEKLKNYNDHVTTVLVFPKSQTDCPIVVAL
jgi:hypothetical protein